MSGKGKTRDNNTGPFTNHFAVTTSRPRHSSRRTCLPTARQARIDPAESPSRGSVAIIIPPNPNDVCPPPPGRAAGMADSVQLPQNSLPISCRLEPHCPSPGGPMCLVCRENTLQDMIAVACGHVFHQNYFEWFVGHQYRAPPFAQVTVHCPECRSECEGKVGYQHSPKPKLHVVLRPWPGGKVCVLMEGLRVYLHA